MLLGKSQQYLLSHIYHIAEINQLI